VHAFWVFVLDAKKVAFTDAKKIASKKKVVVKNRKSA